MRRLRAALAALIVPLALVVSAGPAEAASKSTCLFVDPVQTPIGGSTFCIEVWYTQSADRVNISRIKAWEAQGTQVRRLEGHFRVRNEGGTTAFNTSSFVVRRADDPTLTVNRYPNDTANAPAQVTLIGTAYFKEGIYTEARDFFLHIGGIGTDLG